MWLISPVVAKSRSMSCSRPMFMATIPTPSSRRTASSLSTERPATVTSLPWFTSSAARARGPCRSCRRRRLHVAALNLLVWLTFRVNHREPQSSTTCCLITVRPGLTVIARSTGLFDSVRQMAAYRAITGRPSSEFLGGELLGNDCRGQRQWGADEAEVDLAGGEHPELVGRGAGLESDRTVREALGGELFEGGRDPARDTVEQAEA